ncbi:MAG: hypothetical protein KGQ61_13080, partial [Planctomycetes bacterium]|nr:hypothetical protein [Planctomycetota bacterium]
TGTPTALGMAVRATLVDGFAEVTAVPADANCLFLASDATITPVRTEVELLAFDGPRRFRWLVPPPLDWPPADVVTDDCNRLDVLDAAGNDALRRARRAAMPPEVRAAVDWE